MAWSVDVVSLVIGMLAGAGLGRLILRGAAQQAAERVRAALQAESVELRARLAAADTAQQGLREDIVARDRLLTELREELKTESAAVASLTTLVEQERLVSAEKVALVEQAKTQLSDAFKALAAEALKSNNQNFLDLAKTQLTAAQESAKGDLEKRQAAIADLVSPVRQSLEKMEGQILSLEKERVDAYAGLRQQVSTLVETQQALRGETANLVRALRTPIARGRWGEIQLKRVVEMAGMLDHCDFIEQESVSTEGGRLRPDLTVRLPGGKSIVVDAKTPLEAYLDTVESTDDGVRRDALNRHARHVREHMRSLGGKAYWDQFDHTPEFVVLFLPGENFFSAALEADPALIEAGIEHKVLLATPTTLIGLLKAVAYGWRQERLADNAREISTLGGELYKRLSDLGKHMGKVGESLTRAVGSYNEAVGSLESRVLVSARRFRDLHAASDSVDIPMLEPIDRATRHVQAPELRIVAELGEIVGDV